MRFVYATRPLPKLEFAATSEREAIPADARVFAVCDGAMTIRQHDDQTFSALTDQEQSILEELIVESQACESTDAAENVDGFMRRILRRLLIV